MTAKQEKCPRDFGESLGRPRREQTPPLGQLHDNPSARPSASNRLGSRVCLRKGCGQSYQPRHWKQRYCQEPECLKEVRRWQAAKRQQRRRKRPEVRHRQAAAERARRARQREARRSGEVAANGSAVADARDASGAWSRKGRSSAPFCDRVGCYEPLQPCSNGQARYCGGGLPAGRSASPGSRTQVVGAQNSSGSVQTPLGVSGTTRRLCSAAGTDSRSSGAQGGPRLPPDGR